MTHAADADYVAPAEPEVRAAVDGWRDLKFGALMHFAPGSQWPGSESWNLCSEDEDWISRAGRYADDYAGFVSAYESLPATFDPVAFDAADWAATIADAGMRYAILPTKHHDGFAMWDSRQTDYRITHHSCAYSRREGSDVFGALTSAVRGEGMLVGAYFSKPDWHSSDFWWRRFATPDRHVNYDPERYPERWRRFVDFTQAQIRELTTEYGQIDILWLDGAWVRGRGIETAHDPELLGRAIGPVQDIDMAAIAGQVRGANPATIIVDRTVHGPFENYLTPEQEVPETPLDSPWESCVTLGSAWHSEPDDNTFKSSADVLELLFKTASAGGNLLLGIGPTFRGELPSRMRTVLHEVGEWLRANGSAIYGTVAAETSSDSGVYFTADRSGERHYALIPAAGGESLDLTFTAPAAVEAVRALGGAVVTVEIVGRTVRMRAAEHSAPLALELIRR